MRHAEVSLGRCDTKVPKKENPDSKYQKSNNCTYCNKNFGSRTDKLRHERIHTGEKPFKCKFCGKAFAQKGYAKTHEAIHTGEKKHECIYCPKAFYRNSHLKKQVYF